MRSLPEQLYTAAQVRQIDRLAVEASAQPSYGLMQAAAQAVFHAIQAAAVQPRKLVVFCGAGNNGGDGYVVARLTADAGIDTTIVALCDPKALRGDAALAMRDWARSGGEIQIWQGQSLRDYDVVVDAMFGTGLKREVDGDYAAAIAAINTGDKLVYAVDIPSGLHADTGRVMGCAVKADVTVTFIALKLGLFSGYGRDYCGELIFADLQVNSAVYADIKPYALRMTERLRVDSLPARKKTAHKGCFGHVLFIGGDSGMQGAICMSAMAALRSGAGLVSIATRQAHAALLSVQRPEIMALGVETVSALLPLLSRASVIAIGPGLGQSRWAQDLLAAVLQTDKPLLLDADALNLLAQEPSQRGNWLLTPHPGEAARLLVCDVPAIENDRFAALRALIERYKAYIILKGAASLAGGPSNAIYVCDRGNPGMASGGLGDILSGICAGLLAQGLSMSQVAPLAAYLHACAGDEAAATNGPRGLIASDLLPYIRQWVNP